MFQTVRFRGRQRDLEDALHPERLKAVWKRYVRAALRDQPIPDLHDYYDFHIHLDNRVRVLRDTVLGGLYQPALPLRVRLERHHGVSRQIVLLGPTDALLLDCLANYLLPLLGKVQPSKKAYFSRNQGQPPDLADFEGNLGYPWWILWPKVQEEIFGFTRKHPFIVTADVASFYDTVDFSQLRNYVASLISVSEGLLDFLFFLLERFVWRPDYLPYPGRGLPQANLDGPRLLAHSFLFEVDRHLQKETGGDFVRWMDDIDFGCESRAKAKTILQALDDLLLSRGLHLNSSKCEILTAQEAA